MGYYQGDYRGDYYRGTAGDPFLGGLFSKVFSVGKSLLGFGGGGASSSAITKAVQTGIAKATAFPGVGTLTAAGSKLGRGAVGVAKSHPVLTGAGAAGIIGATGVGLGRMTARQRVAMGLPRRHKRMNPCNPRALRRAIRRAHAFEKLAKHVIGFSSPRKPHGHMYFKKRKRK